MERRGESVTDEAFRALVVGPGMGITDRLRAAAMAVQEVLLLVAEEIDDGGSESLPSERRAVFRSESPTIRRMGRVEREPWEETEQLLHLVLRAADGIVTGCRVETQEERLGTCDYRVDDSLLLVLVSNDSEAMTWCIVEYPAVDGDPVLAGTVRWIFEGAGHGWNIALDPLVADPNGMMRAITEALPTAPDAAG